MHSLYSKLALTLSTASASVVLAPTHFDYGSAAANTEPQRVEPASIPSYAPERTIIAERGGDGLFYLPGKVNGHSVRFLIDTGSNITVLPGSFAGVVAVSDASGSVQMRTVGGSERVQLARLTTVDVAGHHLSGLTAAIHQGGNHAPILGTDALSQMGTVIIEKDRLVIHS